jgi:hypothetical protein
MLLKQPGEVVLREEICHKLWPHDTVVEFDHSINAAIREAQKSNGKNPSIYEQIGDIEAGKNHPAEARPAYASALENAPDSQTTKRIKKKLKTVP